MRKFAQARAPAAAPRRDASGPYCAPDATRPVRTGSGTRRVRAMRATAARADGALTRARARPPQKFKEEAAQQRGAEGGAGGAGGAGEGAAGAAGGAGGTQSSGASEIPDSQPPSQP